jgi:hypothetical protein
MRPNMKHTPLYEMLTVRTFVSVRNIAAAVVVTVLLCAPTALRLSGVTACACTPPGAGSAAAHVDEYSARSACCCGDGICRSAPERSAVHSSVHAGFFVCVDHPVCCCTPAGSPVQDAPPAIVTAERRCASKDALFASVVPPSLLPRLTAAPGPAGVPVQDCRSTVSPHISTTILVV